MHTFWQCLVIAFGVVVFIPYARRGEFRRIWNRPMRFTLACGLLSCLLGWAGAWFRQSSGFHSFGNTVETAAVVMVNLGIIGLCAFLAVFFLSVMRERRNRKRVPAILEPIDEVQALLMRGEMARAIEVYQRENKVSNSEAKEAVEAVAQALEAGLRV